MAFPTTVTLDTFEREVEIPLSNGGKWAGLSWCVSPGKIWPGKEWGAELSGTTGKLFGAYWTPEQISAPTIDAELTLEVREGEFIGLWINLNTATHSGYFLKLTHSSESGKTKFELLKYLNGVSSLLESSTPTFGRNNKFGISVASGTITIWTNTSGSWTELFTKSDSTYNYGRVGMEVLGGTPGLRKYEANEVKTNAITISPLSSISARLFSPISIKATIEPKSNLEAKIQSFSNFQTPSSFRDQYPFHLVIGEEDFTYLLTEDFSFSNVDPGGYESASFVLPKDLPQILRGMRVCLDCGTKVAWEGRVKEIQRSMSSKTLIQCEGYGVKLKKQLMQEIFVDRDLTHWESPSLGRQRHLAEVGRAAASFSIVTEPNKEGTVLGSIEAGFTGPWATEGIPSSEAWYNCHEIPIRKLFTLIRGSKHVGFDWGLDLISQNIIATKAEGAHIVEKTGTPEANITQEPGYLTATTIEEEEGKFIYSRIKHESNAAGGENNVLYAVYFEKLSIYGSNFAKSIYSTGRGPDPVGYWPSQIIEYVISKAKGFSRGVVEQGPKTNEEEPSKENPLLPHSVYLIPTSLEKIISDIAKLSAWHWGVWESLEYLCGNREPRIDFRPYTELPTAWINRSSCEELDVRENLENIFNEAEVTYTEPGGVEITVNVKITNPILEQINTALSRNSENTINQAVELNIGTSTKVAAEAYGKLALMFLLQQARNTGTATIINPVYEIDGGPKPAFLLKSGIDRLRVPDLPSFGVWGENNELPITRMSCSATAEGIVTNLEFGLSKNTLEAFQAQLAADITAAG